MIARIMRRFTWISLVVVFGLPAAAISFGGGIWPLELAHHFVAHLAVLGALVSALLALARRWAPAVTAGAFALAFSANSMMAVFVPAGGAISSAVAAPSAGSRGGAKISLVSFNILANHEEPADLLHWLAQGPADVLVLLEATRAWDVRLAALDAVYPYRVMALPGDGLPADVDQGLVESSGIAVFSRLPLRDVRISYPAGPLKPAVTVKVSVAGQVFTLLAAHPTSPVTFSGLRARDEYFSRLADGLAAETGPLVVAGDFNATPFTPIFRRFVDRLRLEPPRRPPATYPAPAGPFGLAIDHVLVRDVRLRRLTPLPAHGSDHRALLAELILHDKAGNAHEPSQ